MANKATLSKRIYQDDNCSTDCPYFDYCFCDLYGVEIVVEDTGCTKSVIRTKKCIHDVIPDSNAEVIRLLTAIYNKIK